VKEGESFSQYFSRLCGIAVAIGLLILFQDIMPHFSQIGRTVIEYAAFSWSIFVFVPFSAKHIWTNRVKLKRLVVRILPGLRSYKETSNSPGSNTGTMEKKTVLQTSGSTMIMNDSTKAFIDARSNESLPVPMNMLPVNPNPFASALLTAERASEMIGNALQLVGLSFEGDIEILNIESGPTLQSITFKLPSKIQLTHLMKKSEDLANHLGHHEGFTVTSSLQYASAAVFVIPHKDRAFVYMRDVARDLLAASLTNELPIVLGKDMLGNPIIVDLAKLPHVLVAGTTGSGKSVLINSVLASLLSTRSPNQLKLLLIDPKMVELISYTGFPHMLMPPVTDVRRAYLALQKVVDEMEKRYEIFSKKGMRNIAQYNKNYPNEPCHYIVVCVDEYADLKLILGDSIEEPIQRIAQKGRAAGIHLIPATQRPSVDVINGVIKANLPSRIAFKLQSNTDFRVVMDTGGPNLLGKGDGVCVLNGGSQIRFQSAAVSGNDDEAGAFIENLKKYWTQQSDLSHQDEWSLNEEDEDENDPAEGQQMIEEYDGESEQVENNTEMSNEGEKTSPYIKSNLSNSNVSEYDNALQLAKDNGGISVSMLQRSLRCGYTQALKLIQQMEQDNIIGPYESGQEVRPLLITRQLSDELLRNQIKQYVCQTQSTNTGQIRDHLRVRKEKVLQLMGDLVEEGFLYPPENARNGYTIAWDEEQVKNYLDSQVNF
jgi:hypothetical protein